MLMIDPARCFSIVFITAWVEMNTLVRLVEMTSSHSAAFMRRSRLSRVMPALLTRMSIRPWAATVFEMRLSIDSRDETSTT